MVCVCARSAALSSWTSSVRGNVNMGPWPSSISSISPIIPGLSHPHGIGSLWRSPSEVEMENDGETFVSWQRRWELRRIGLKNMAPNYSKHSMPIISFIYFFTTYFCSLCIIFMGHRKFVLIKVNAEIWKHSIIATTKSDAAQVVRQDVNNAEV